MFTQNVPSTSRVIKRPHDFHVHDVEGPFGLSEQSGDGNAKPMAHNQTISDKIGEEEYFPVLFPVAGSFLAEKINCDTIGSGTRTRAFSTITILESDIFRNRIYAYRLWEPPKNTSKKAQGETFVGANSTNQQIQQIQQINKISKPAKPPSMSRVEVIEMSSHRGEYEPEFPAFRLGSSLSHRKGNTPLPSDKLIHESAMYSSEANPDSFPDGGLEAYLVLAGAFFGLIADFGIPNGMGAIEAYVSKNQLADYKPSTVSWIFSLHLGTMYFGGVFFGGLFDKYGARKLLVLGTAFMFVGLITTAESTQLYQFVLSFGILTALGTSLAMAPLIGVMSHWFLKKRAMACSTATVGGLIGASVFVIMLQSLYKSVGYKWAVRILAFLCLGCMVVANVLVRERKQEPETSHEEEELSSQYQPSQAHAASMVSEPVAAAPVAEPPIPVKPKSWRDVGGQILSNVAPLKDIRFVSLTIAVFLSEISSMTILTYLASFALAGGVAESKSYLLLTIVNISGIPARLITGVLADMYGRFNVMLVTSIFSMIFVWGLLTPSNGRLAYLYAFTVLYGISSSAAISLIAACLGQICPASQFGKNYGVLYFCLAFLTVLGMYSASLVINTGSDHDYKMWIVFEGCVSVAGVFAWVWARWCNVGFRACKF
ncbi:hypothetical protein JCM33374_g4517 [Metschnikowia sp. JCM 33374]|nr:hypothetical protein JCM33374_g4517 [Metschnikowia sp. JCM 33374]